jgi:hypothetical protein
MPQQFPQITILPVPYPDLRKVIFHHAQTFYACWTRKEALLKAIGVGLSFLLSDFSVTTHPDRDPELEDIKHGRPAHGFWQTSPSSMATRDGGRLGRCFSMHSGVHWRHSFTAVSPMRTEKAQAQGQYLYRTATATTFFLCD